MAPNVWIDLSSINALSESGETPLISAVTTGGVELVRLMLQRGTNVEARCVDHMTPLMHAVMRGHLSILDLLLSEGVLADVTTAG